MKRSIFAFVAAVACASTTIASVSGSVAGAQGEETTGVDKTTIKVGYVYIDTSALADTGFVVDFGNPQAQVKAFVDDLNDRGGINGRKVEVSTYRFDPLAADPLAVQRAACLSATEDDGVFAVLAQVIFHDPILCVTRQHRTPMLIQGGTSTQTIRRSNGRLYLANFNWADALREGAQAFGKSLKGRKVAIVYQDEPGLTADVKRGFEQPLAAQGVELAEKIVLPATVGAEITAAIPPAIERLAAAGVDSVFIAVNAYVASVFMTQGVQAGYKPTYYATDMNEGSLNIVPGLAPKGAMKDAQGATWRNTGAAESGEHPTAFDEQCQHTYAAKTGATPPAFGTDEYGAIATTCALVKLFELGASKAGTELTRSSFTDAMSTLRDFELGGGSKGSYGPNRFDAPNAIRKLVIKASCSAPGSDGKPCWVPKGTFVPFKR